MAKFNTPIIVVTIKPMLKIYFNISPWLCYYFSLSCLFDCDNGQLTMSIGSVSYLTDNDQDIFKAGTPELDGFPVYASRD